MSTETTAGAATTERQLPSTVDEITPDWLTEALGRDVTSVAVDDVIWGTATKVLATVTYADGSSAALCIKGGFDENLRAMGLEASYELEVGFYDEIAPLLTVRVPACHYAKFVGDERQGIVVLENLAARNCTFGDPLQPWDVDRVAAAVEVQATWHRQTWEAAEGPVAKLPVGSTSVRHAAGVLLSEQHWTAHFGNPEMLQPLPELQDRERLMNAYRALWARDEQGPVALAHGDSHIGNTYVESDGKPGFLDWQGVCRAPGFYDLAYFIGGALTPQDRRAHERSLVNHYCDVLAAGGGPSLDRDEAWLDYRRYALHGFLWAVTPPTMQPVERVRAMGERHMTAIVELDTFQALGV